jgi:hypothetical protein
VSYTLILSLASSTRNDDDDDALLAFYLPTRLVLRRVAQLQPVISTGVADEVPEHMLWLLNIVYAGCSSGIPASLKLVSDFVLRSVM